MNYTHELIDFIKNSPTAYHTVETIKGMLVSEGYTELESMYSSADFMVGRDGTTKDEIVFLYKWAINIIKHQ